MYEAYSSTESERQSRERAVRAGLDASHLRDSDHPHKCDHSVAAWQYRHCRRRHQRASGPRTCRVHGWGSSVPSYSRIPEGSPGGAADPRAIPDGQHSENSGGAIVNWWSNTPKYTCLLKSFYGDRPQENDYGYAWLPKADDGASYSWLDMCDCHVPGQDQKHVHMEPEPAGSHPNTNKTLKALQTWMVGARKHFQHETASFWHTQESIPRRSRQRYFYCRPLVRWNVTEASPTAVGWFSGATGRLNRPRMPLPMERWLTG